ncbi:MAG: hypothetical protein Q8Q39_00915 [bacterium]|nr:hypothetical protein [bacterium]
MSRRTKIIILIAVLALVGVAAFLFFRKPPAAPEPTASPAYGFLPESLQRLFGGGGARPGSVSPTPVPRDVRLREKLFRLSHEPAHAPIVVGGNTVRYFSRSDGTLWEADVDGLAHTRVSDTPIANIAEAQWASGGSKALLTIAQDDGTARIRLYEVAAKRAKDLDPFVRSAAFAPDGARIIYQYLNTENGSHWIAIADPDGSNAKIIWQPTFLDYTLAWPKTETAIIQSKPSYASRTALYGLDTRTGTLTKILPQDAFGLAATWAWGGTRLLASQVSAEGELGNALLGTFPQSQLTELFGIKTLAEKCLWRAKKAAIICGVPTAIPQNAVLPDDYYKGKVISTDDVVEVDGTTLERRVIAGSRELAPVFDMDAPILSPDESLVFFVNRHDGYIYALRLNAQ